MKIEQKKLKIIVVIVGIIIAFTVTVCISGMTIERIWKRIDTKLKLSTIEYDIETSYNPDEYTDPKHPELAPQVIEGGYSSTIYYTLINTQKFKKYEIEYYYLFNNSKEDDQVTITEKDITQEEANEYIKKYTKSDDMKKASNLIRLNY